MEVVIGLEKYLDIKGKNVVDKNGSVKGRIESFIIDGKNNKVNSLVVCSTAFFTSHYILPLRNVKSLSEPIEYVNSIYKIRKSVLVRNKEIVLQNHMGKEITDTRGNVLGKLIDLFFNKETGELKAMIASNGFFEDIFDGRRVLIINNNTKFTKNRIVVEDNNLDMRNDVYFKKYLRN